MEVGTYNDIIYAFLILPIVCLGEFGKFERGFLLHSQDNSDQPDEIVPMPAAARSQAAWWIITLTAFKQGVPIPDPRDLQPCICIEIFADAAGISREKYLNGWGGCAEVNGVTTLALAPWDRRMIKPDGEYNRTLTWLEALAAFNTIFSVADLVAGKRVKLITDNKGVYHAFRKGHSSCDNVYTVILGIKRFVASLDVSLCVEWRPRCSDSGSVAADMLSKGLFYHACNELGVVNPRVGRYSHTLACYTINPQVSRVLGQAVSLEAAEFTETLPTGYEKSAEVMKLYRKHVFVK